MLENGPCIRATHSKFSDHTENCGHQQPVSSPHTHNFFADLGAQGVQRTIFDGQCALATGATIFRLVSSTRLTQIQLMDESKATYTTFRNLVMMSLFLASSLGLVFSGPASAASRDQGADVFGQARVIDGDTLDISGVRVRLEGIDAPERGQRCNRSWLGLTWRCGRAATRALRTLIGGQRFSAGRKVWINIAA